MSEQKYIAIKNATTHNLKGVDVLVPHKKLVVITGVSGSGKTSLAYDTLYAEGHRRYIESLSSYARQFVERLPKPPVDYIKGLSPCIALQQKVSSNNPRSTVGTTTEIYDYLRVLFARVGVIIHPVTGQEIKRQYPQDVVQYIQTISKENNVYVGIPISHQNNLKQELEKLLQSGFSRVLINDKIQKITDVISNIPSDVKQCYLIIDRISLENLEDEDNISRITDSVETAYNQGNGVCYIITENNHQWQFKKFSHTLESDGIVFEEPTPQLFAFTNPYGICPDCKGTSKVFDFDFNKVFPYPDASLENYIYAIFPSYIKSELSKLKSIHKDELSIRPIGQLTESEKDWLWNGDNKFKGIKNIFKRLDEEFQSSSYSRYENNPYQKYKSKITCPGCKGSRLRKEALYVKINGYSIADFVEMPIDELLQLFKTESDKIPHKQAIQKLLDEIISRLQFLCDVGLPYLTLNREIHTLSGGEYQRVLLTTALGSSLTGSIYVLDEPTTGLHSRDTHRLIKALKKLRDEGNTVVVVEHDEEVMKNADWIIDMGPLAGKNGGKVVFQGSVEDMKNADTLTAEYLFGKEKVKVNTIKRPFKDKDFIYFKNATANNLKNIDIQFPFNAITCITGVSGSGKSSLVENEIVPEFEKLIIHFKNSEKLSGAANKIKQLHYINQNSISTSTRSNCATYTKVYDDIRILFSKYAQIQGFYFDPSYFSFNVQGGRCEKCQGEGIVRIPMQFMADIEMICDECNGQRFKKDVLQVNYNGVNINDILSMSVEEAYNTFDKEQTFVDLKKRILHTLNILKKVGLGYISMGQSTSKMSGGELQRLKIATFLQEEKAQPSLFVLDEPSTGLHFYDIEILMKALYELIFRGHTVLIIEHQPDIIKCADWIIDLGPEGGKKGGYVVFQGTLEQFKQCNEGYTSQCVFNVENVKMS